MKVYQCIHKYSPHIPFLERKHNIGQRSLSFEELRNIIIQDGYAAPYILKPAIEGKADQVFYTIWDYERLQHKWAEEHGLKTRNLDEIKLAQIEEFKPDVFYNHSPRYDNNFVEKLPENQKMKKVCWDAVITSYPFLNENYDLRLTLFEPFVKYWNKKGLKASLLSPAYSPTWNKLMKNEREIDVFFYGQTGDFFFSERNQLILKLLEWQTKNQYDVRVHLQRSTKKQSFVNMRYLRRLTRWIDKTPPIIKKHALAPLYGEGLYQAVANTKIVINAFTNYNGLFKDNMRNYEATGLGALMISEDGIYPDFLESDRDFLTYKTADELIEKIEYALSLPDQGREMANRAHQKLITNCTKEKQWATFCKLVENL
jgi:hypothetical protein